MLGMLLSFSLDERSRIVSSVTRISTRDDIVITTRGCDLSRVASCILINRIRRNLRLNKDKFVAATSDDDTFIYRKMTGNFFAGA